MRRWRAGAGARYWAGAHQKWHAASMRTVIVDGDALTVQDVIDVGRGDARAELGPGVPDRMEASRRVVADAIAGDAPVYGVNTGFGALADTSVGEQDLRRLQRADRKSVV